MKIELERVIKEEAYYIEKLQLIEQKIIMLGQKILDTPVFSIKLKESLRSDLETAYSKRQIYKKALENYSYQKNALEHLIEKMNLIKNEQLENNSNTELGEHNINEVTENKMLEEYNSNLNNENDQNKVDIEICENSENNENLENKNLEININKNDIINDKNSAKQEIIENKSDSKISLNNTNCNLNNSNSFLNNSNRYILKPNQNPPMIQQYERISLPNKVYTYNQLYNQYYINQNSIYKFQQTHVNYFQPQIVKINNHNDVVPENMFKKIEPENMFKKEVAASIPVSIEIESNNILDQQVNENPNNSIVKNLEYINYESNDQITKVVNNDCSIENKIDETNYDSLLDDLEKIINQQKEKKSVNEESDLEFFLDNELSKLKNKIEFDIVKK